MSASEQIKRVVDLFKREPQLKDKTDGMAEGLLLGAQLADESNERSKDVDGKFKQLQREYTENGNGTQTTAEINIARDGESVLADRLKRDHDEVTAQLAQKANKEETRLKAQKIEPEDWSERALALATGQGTINLLSIPQDGSVTTRTLSSEIASKLNSVYSPIKNELINGDMEGDISTWVFGGSNRPTITTEVPRVGTKSLKISPTSQSSVAYQDIDASNGDRIYTFLYANLTQNRSSGGSEATYLTRILEMYDKGGFTNGTFFHINSSLLNQWQFVSGIKSVVNSGLRVSFGSTSNTSRDVYVDTVGSINLTKVFGSGKELSKIEMDELVKSMPKGWFDGEVLNKDLTMVMLEKIRKSSLVMNMDDNTTLRVVGEKIINGKLELEWEVL